MSSRSCPDWPRLMELAPELQFKHYTVREATLPAEVLMRLSPQDANDVAICCDLEKHVFNHDHTAADVRDALLSSHWFELTEWLARPRGGGASA